MSDNEPMNHGISGQTDPKQTVDAPRITRRSVLAAGIAGGLLPSALPRALATPRVLNPSAGDHDILDVLVVGSGVSGCYAAWRLSQSNPALRIAVCERSDRIGGRLWSVKPTGHSDQVAELGGMRIASSQTPLLNLVDKFKLTTTNYPPTLPEDIYYLRGVRCRSSKLVASEKYGYRVPDALKGMSIDDLFNKVVKTATGRLDWTRHELETTFREVTYKGRNLHDLPRAWVFEDILGHEASELLFDAIGYGFQNNSAGLFLAESLQDLVITDYRHVDGGYQRVPLTMAAESRARGVDFRFGLEMIDFAFEGDLSVVTFKKGDGGTSRIRARKVITTLPLSAYGLLPANCPLRGESALARMAAELIHVPAVKIYVNFPDQWWNTMDIKAGRSITDLPLRQCFYLDDPSGRGLTLSPYASGGHSAGFWGPLLDAGRNRAKGDSLAGRTIVRQLREMHGVDVPDATEIIYRYFDGAHQGYGWNEWRPGARPWHIATAARRPIPGRQVFCTGQATAQVRGWVMDTISSTESVLRDDFRLDRPEWWPAGYEVV